MCSALSTSPAFACEELPAGGTVGAGAGGLVWPLRTRHVNAITDTRNIAADLFMAEILLHRLSDSKQAKTKSQSHLLIAICQLLIYPATVFYIGETVRLVRGLPEILLPIHTEGVVAQIIRSPEGYPLSAEINFYPNSKPQTHTVPFESIELVISSTGGCTGVFWDLGKPREQLIESAMNAVLDHGFEMRQGLNCQQLRYNREDRFWENQDRFSDPTGAQIVTSAPSWDGCIAAFSGRERYHLEFRLGGRKSPYILLHQRFETYWEQQQTTQAAMKLLRLMYSLCSALEAASCAMPVADNWIRDESWNSLLQPPVYPDLLIIPEPNLPKPLPAGFRAQKLVGGKAILTSLPVKFSPTDDSVQRSEDELKLHALRRCKALGEKAYDQMYDAHSSSDATGLYSDAKEAFYDAIRLANELGLAEESAALNKRLDHIKAVFRSQFS
jgi:hypothetical protein